MTENIN